MIKKFWRDPVWSAVIAAAIFGGVSYFLGVWSSIWHFIQTVPSLLVTPLSIPVWVLFLVVPFLLFAVPVIRSLRSAREPRFVSYTRDKIFDINWTWGWLPPGMHSSSYSLRNLSPRCPSCHAALELNDYSGSLVNCVNENCNWQWERQRHPNLRIRHSSKLESNVRNEIDRKIHAGERG